MAKIIENDSEILMKLNEYLNSVMLQKLKEFHECVSAVYITDIEEFNQIINEIQSIKNNILNIEQRIKMTVNDIKPITLKNFAHYGDKICKNLDINKKKEVENA